LLYCINMSKLLAIVIRIQTTFISFSSLILFLLFIPAALSGASSLIFYTLLAYVITGVIAVRFVKSDFSKLSQKGQSLLLSFPIAIFLFAAYIFLS